MPYSAGQLIAYYTALTGVAPDTASALILQAYAVQNMGATLSDAQTLAFVFSSVGVQNSFEVAESTYLFFTGATTSAAGLAYLEGLPGSGNANGLTTPYYSGAGGSLTAPNTSPASGAIGFNTENRYYNFAINLATPGGAGAGGFTASYGGLSFAQTVAAAYETIVGSSNVGTAAAAAAVADITSRQSFFQQIAAMRGGDTAALSNPDGSLILKAVVIGYILEEANRADVGTYAKAIDQFESSVAAGNAVFNSNALATYAPGGPGYNTGVGLTAATVSLTTGTDTLTNAAGNVTFIAQVGGAAATLGPSDTVNAQGSNNTLIVNTAGGVQSDASGGAILNGIQTINVRVTDGPGAGGPSTGATLNQAAVPNAVVLNSYLSTGTVAFNNVSGSTTVGLVGNGGVQGGSLVANFTSGSTANVVVAGGAQSFASAGGAGTTNVAITGASTTNAATVNLTSSGQANFLDALTLARSTTTLNIVANQAFTSALTNQVSGANTLATLSVAGPGAVNLGATAFGDALRSVTSTSAGGLRAAFTTPAAGLAFSVTTAAGAADRITLSGATAQTVVNTGGGGDLLQITGAIAAGASLNGGGGATLAATSSAYGGVASFSAANRALITGFSTLAIGDAGGLANGQVYDLSLIGAQNLTSYGVAATGVATLNATSGAVVTFLGANASAPTNGDSTNTGVLVVNETGATAASSTNDLLLLAYAQQSASAVSTVQVAGVETVQVTAGRAAGAATNLSLTLNLTEQSAATPALKTLTFAGDEQYVFTAVAAQTALTSIISTSLQAVTLNVATISNFAGGSSNGTAATPIGVTTGAGSDSLTIKDFVRVTAGAGADTINVVAPSTSQTYSTFVDPGTGDRVNFTNSIYSAPADATFTAITLQPTATLQNYLDAAAQGTAAPSGGDGTNAISYFVFGGNTYLVADNSAASTFQNGVDSVIQLVGSHTLTGITNGYVTLGS